jgi:hypothetical protein
MTQRYTEISFPSPAAIDAVNCSPRLGVASRYAEQELLTANPTFSSVYFVCSLEIKTRNDDRLRLSRQPFGTRIQYC